MRQHFLGIVLCSIIFVTGVSVDIVWHRYNQPLVEINGPKNLLQVEDILPIGLQFCIACSVYSFRGSDLSLGVTHFESSDGERLNKTDTEYDSAIEANNQFQREIKSAVKVIKSEPKLNGSGICVGYRAIALFPLDAKPENGVLLNKSSNRHNYKASIIWTDGASFHSINGPTAGHVLSLENLKTLDCWIDSESKAWVRILPK